MLSVPIASSIKCRNKEALEQLAQESLKWLLDEKSAINRMRKSRRVRALLYRGKYTYRTPYP